MPEPIVKTFPLWNSAPRERRRIMRRSTTKIMASLVCCALLATAPRAQAQTMSDLLRQSAVIQYPFIKATLSAVYDRDNRDVGADKIVDKFGMLKTYSVASCSRTGIDYIDGGKGQLVADLALDVIAWTSELPKVGYPTAAWKGLTDGYEASMLALIDQLKIQSRVFDENHPYPDKISRARERFEGQLVEALGRYRAAGHRSLPVVTDEEGGCGGGDPGVDVTIKTDPPGSKVYFIPVLEYKLCDYVIHDPYDHARCDWWREVYDGSRQNIAGELYYQWQGDKPRHGKLEERNKHDGDVVRLSEP